MEIDLKFLFETATLDKNSFTQMYTILVAGPVSARCFFVMWFLCSVVMKTQKTMHEIRSLTALESFEVFRNDFYWKWPRNYLIAIFLKKKLAKSRIQNSWIFWRFIEDLSKLDTDIWKSFNHHSWITIVYSSHCQYIIFPAYFYDFLV